jgi:hypothetical protein
MVGVLPNNQGFYFKSLKILALIIEARIEDKNLYSKRVSFSYPSSTVKSRRPQK